MSREWTLPYSPSQINGTDAGHQGPSCRSCAAYQHDRQLRAETAPMLRGNDDRLYRSPHAGTYLFEARYSRWSCTQGAHGPIQEFAFAHQPPAADSTDVASLPHDIEENHP